MYKIKNSKLYERGEGTFLVNYFGESRLDNRILYTSGMIPWIMSEILGYESNHQQVILQIRNSYITIYSTLENKKLIEVPICDCIRYFPLSTIPIDPHSPPILTTYFGIIIKTTELDNHLKLFSTIKSSEVSEVMSTLAEAETSSPNLTQTAISPTSSITFEVLYLGKLKMSYRKAPSSFIDDALDKFKAYESERGSKESNESRGSSTQDIDEADHKIQSNPSILIPPDLVIPKVEFSHPLQDIRYSNDPKRIRNSSGESVLVKSVSLPIDETGRSRALSTGNQPRVKVLKSSNRTMILIVGKEELRIISPDDKNTLLHKNIGDITQVGKGIINKDCFGFICGEIGSNRESIYIGYIFKTDTINTSNDIIQTLKRASSITESPKKVSCEHCPMFWYHNICVDIEGLSCEKSKGLILNRLKQLSEDDRNNILIKFDGAEIENIEEQVKLIMMLIRLHCESRQLNHVHDTIQNRHEFLQSHLSGGSGDILMKAKRSITTSFDQLIKRKEQRQGKLDPILPHHVIQQHKDMSPSPSREEVQYSNSPLDSTTFRQRSTTLDSIGTQRILSELKQGGGRRGSELYKTGGKINQLQLHSPMMNIFLKVGPQQSKANNNSTPANSHRKGSWRQAIFKRVVSPSTPHQAQSKLDNNIPSFRFQSSTPSSSLRKGMNIKMTPRELWKSAIKEQIMLNRMEKQNTMLKSQQKEADEKRIKLSYDDICSIGDALGIEAMNAKAENGEVCDMYFSRAVIITGIPKHKRGQVWQLFIRQYNLRTKSNAIKPSLTPYKQLLIQLTPHQHAILIDLGRTFPNHPYFNNPLRSGQLALFNLLKAYSLLDPEVGYCQGLSFVGGLLLMHLDEEDAFNVLKYFMFEMGGREYYQPDLSGLQLKLYQLNRIIFEEDKDIHLLLYNNDVLPSLYAAPWFLTMFASQFPIGFAVRILDLAFVQGADVMVKFALLLIQENRDALMSCSGLEQIMNCFKNVVTQINPSKVDNYIKKAFDMNIDEQMLIYRTEYSVMHDETFLAYLTDKKLSEDDWDTSSTESRGNTKDIQSLISYIQQLESKLNSVGEEYTRPQSISKLFHKSINTTDN